MVSLHHSGRDCPVCGGEGDYLRDQFDDRYGFPGQFPLFACKSCEHKFLSAEFGLREIEDLYTVYYPRKEFNPTSCVLPTNSNVLVAWLAGDRRSAFRWVESGKRVLDIGCGTCESLLYHQSRGCDVHGVEADRNVIPIADHFKLNVIYGAFDPANYPADYFDYVTMDQVIEHFPDPLLLLGQVRRILKPGGRVVISTPNGCGWGQRVFGGRWLHWHAPYHLHSFSRESIRLAANKAGYQVQKCASITSSDWLLMQWAHLLSYPTPGHASDYWSQVRRADFRTTMGLLVIGAFHRLKFNHLITRLMDAVRLGDNHLVILQKAAD